MKAYDFVLYYVLFIRNFHFQYIFLCSIDIKTLLFMLHSYFEIQHAIEFNYLLPCFLNIIYFFRIIGIHV
jgi:hypothetical protein